ncbi:hypothetical protein HJP15_06980 [Pseudoalteromonas sp. NEC-BIFX-2020_002]|uniref:hypothetical protein n=1 Tax=Pseudoalteromonas sp. NEC-BIFX-2020_002 TaxID=2732353 RepID=UPI00147752DC|nr:hypothetical protein [Pseudoalteromonas sp. NEC-BIFX-2020_002]NNG42668.1 hypothetical protein [Pseudoalteromonas sp. NEC-BIFX-2020_002]
MTDVSNSIKRISQAPRKDPLIDLKTLSTTAKSATVRAKLRAKMNRATITIAKNGYIVKVSPDGQETRVKSLTAIHNFPSLVDDLCQG